MNKIEELKLEVRNNEPLLLAICEIKPKYFRYELNEAEIQIPNYNLHYNSLERNDERGIAFYIHNTIDANQVHPKSIARESIWLEIELKNQDKLLAGCVYRSPSNTKEQNNDFIQMMREMTQHQYSHTLIMGDFNLPKIDWNIWESTSADLADTNNRFIEVLRDAFYINMYIHQPEEDTRKIRHSWI